MGVARWDPMKHPRDRLGAFMEVLGGLKVGDRVRLPGGVEVSKGRGGMRINTPKPVATSDTDSAAKLALKLAGIPAAPEKDFIPSVPFSNLGNATFRTRGEHRETGSLRHDPFTGQSTVRDADGKRLASWDTFKEHPHPGTVSAFNSSRFKRAAKIIDDHRLGIPDEIDELTDDINNIERGESADYEVPGGSIEVARQERSDPDGWEFTVDGDSAPTDRDAAEIIARRRLEPPKPPSVHSDAEAKAIGDSIKREAERKRKWADADPNWNRPAID